MPVDRIYCELTPESQMGFSQRSTCKALGLLPRTSSAHFGEYVVSEQYKSRTKSKSKSKSKLHTKSKSKSRSKSKSLKKHLSRTKSERKSKSKSREKSKSKSKSCGVCK